METDVLIHNILTLLHFTSIFQRIINYFNVCMHASKSLQSCPTLCNPMDYIAHQASLSIELSRQEYWSGLPCLPPGDLPNPGIKPRSSALQADSLPAESPGKSIYMYVCVCIYVYAGMYTYVYKIHTWIG